MQRKDTSQDQSYQSRVDISVDNFLKNEPPRTHQTPTRPSMTKRKDSQVWHELSSTITQPVDISDIRIAGENELTVNDNPWHVENESYQGVDWV